MDGINAQFLPVASPGQTVSEKAAAILKQAKDMAWYIAASEIAGQGLFTSSGCLAGDRIGLALTYAGKDAGDNDQWNLTNLGQHCNHQTKCNTLLVACSDTEYWLVAKEDITEDEELTVDYEQVTRQIGYSAEMLWQGKPVGSADLSTYTEKG